MTFGLQCTSPVDASLLCSDTFCLLFAALLDCSTSPGRMKGGTFWQPGEQCTLDVINQAISDESLPDS